MRIRVGYELGFECAGPTHTIAMLRVRPERQGDLEGSDALTATGPDGSGLPVEVYADAFGNLCSRFTLPPGRSTLTSDAVIRDPGVLDPVHPDLPLVPVELLPAETLLYLLPSRYCDTEHLMEEAWRLFAHTPLTWARVQAIVAHAHGRIRFDYMQARATRTASEGHAERVGVCRDFAHLAVTLCRCMNVPARYATGYLGDIGVPVDVNPMDVSAWFEAYVGGRWWTFDARHNRSRIGRIVQAYGRDAADVPLTHSFGRADLKLFKVVTDELAEPGVVAA